jgi:D-alanyl-D-alanine carboxypeptidase
VTDKSTHYYGITRLTRAFFVTLCAGVMLFTLNIAFSADAEAASKKSCKNYISKQAYRTCMSGKTAGKNVRYHRKQHTVFTRPQPASFVVDANTGKILHAENADAPRYPASLTKMMTLYLTFDALKKGTLKLDQDLPVSRHASLQPQTNIGLNSGDRLEVKDAILSLVVRSANDASVVLAEALGGTEVGFARKMTEKARALGMKSTTFYNANGLPEPKQLTTARDMAVLGLALRRDFPQYYSLFKTESFSYRGVTYTTHNRVMTRYDGVDGIKTGYIRASGFNLVTSAKKYNHTLVGVVLGGTTWRARDDKMITLLDQNFSRLAAADNIHPDAQMFARSEPAASPNPVFVDERENEGQGDLNSESMGTAVNLATQTPAKAEKQIAERIANDWGIQVGAYARKSDAVKAATSALKKASQALGASKISIAERDKGNAYYRTRFINLSQSNAESACKALSTKRTTCFVYRNN